MSTADLFVRLTAESVSIQNINWPVYPLPLTFLPKNGDVSYTHEGDISTKFEVYTTFYLH